MWLFFLQDARNPPGWGRRSILLCQSSSSSPAKLLTYWTSGSLLCFILKVKVKVESNSLRHGGLVHRILQARILEWVAFPISRGSSQSRDQTLGPTLQSDSLPAVPQGKPKNTRVGSLSLLQRIFQAQESNRGLLHCRQILYQFSYQGSPLLPFEFFFFFLLMSSW